MAVAAAVADEEVLVSQDAAMPCLMQRGHGRWSLQRALHNEWLHCEGDLALPHFTRARLSCLSTYDEYQCDGWRL